MNLTETDEKKDTKVNLFANRDTQPASHSSDHIADFGRQIRRVSSVCNLIKLSLNGETLQTLLRPPTPPPHIGLAKCPTGTVDVQVLQTSVEEDLKCRWRRLI